MINKTAAGSRSDTSVLRHPEEALRIWYIANGCIVIWVILQYEFSSSFSFSEYISTNPTTKLQTPSRRFSCCVSYFGFLTAQQHHDQDPPQSQPKGMSSSTEIKKKHVRFASMEDNDDDDDEQEEETLFDKRRDVKGLKSALKTSKGAAKCRCKQRVEVVGESRGGPGACGRWMVTFTLCASFLSLVTPSLQKKYRVKEKTNKQLLNVM